MQYLDERHAGTIKGEHGSERRSQLPPGSAGLLDSPEMQLLLCCARRRLEPEQEARMRQLLATEPSWSVLRNLALRHKLLPLMTGHLAGFSELIPPAITHRFTADRLASATRALQCTGELLGLLDLFHAERIGVVPYKGPVLAAQLYGNVALRPPGDLDLLVRRGDVLRVRQLLISRGYRPVHVLRDGGEEFMLQSRYGETFLHPTAAPVEIHWAFTNGDIALPLDFDSVEPNLETVSVGRADVSAFGREDLLIILCVHGAKHRWDKLEWICGVAEALRTAPPSLCWDSLVDRSTTLGVRRMLLLGLVLAHDLLQAPVPQQILRLASADGAVQYTARQVPGFLVAESVEAEANSLPTDMFRLRLRERMSDRWRFLAYRLTTPSRPEEWKAFTLGKYAVPLHGFSRPFRVLRKLLSAIQ